jgi:hypothetical protein
MTCGRAVWPEARSVEIPLRALKGAASRTRRSLPQWTNSTQTQVDSEIAALRHVSRRVPSLRLARSRLVHLASLDFGSRRDRLSGLRTRSTKKHSGASSVAPFPPRAAAGRGARLEIGKAPRRPESSRGRSPGDTRSDGAPDQNPVRLPTRLPSRRARGGEALAGSPGDRVRRPRRRGRSGPNNIDLLAG